MAVLSTASLCRQTSELQTCQPLTMTGSPVNEHGRYMGCFVLSALDPRSFASGIITLFSDVIGDDEVLPERICASWSKK